MDIHPVVTAEDHKAALKEIERLWEAEPGTANGNLLDVLVTLVERYEEKQFPLGDADPIDVIKVHMEMTGRSQSDLANLFGSPSRASEVINRRRALTVDMIHKLHKVWGIPAQYLIQPYDLKRQQHRPLRGRHTIMSRHGSQIKKRA